MATIADQLLEEAKVEVYARDLTNLTPDQVVTEVALLAESKLVAYYLRSSRRGRN